MDKVKQYNQVLLAIIGTGALILLLFGGLVFLYGIIDNSWREPPTQGGIISDEGTEELLEDSLRKQVVSLYNFELIDSASRTFIIPVGQADLEEAEASGSKVDLKYSYRKSNYYKGGYVYNNLVLYEGLSGTSTIIFDQRVSISSYYPVRVYGKPYLLIEGTKDDTNGNGFLDGNDLQRLFVYQLDRKQLLEVDARANMSVMNTEVFSGGEEVVVNYGIDRDEDGKFESYKESKVFYLLDIETASLKEIMRSNQIQQLQKLLEGSN